jgi:hypothetical protein
MNRVKPGPISRSEARLGLAQASQEGTVGRQGLAVPRELGSARHELDLGAAFVQQSSGFHGRLTSAQDDD